MGGSSTDIVGGEVAERQRRWTVGCMLSKKKQKSLCFPAMQKEAAYVAF